MITGLLPLERIGYTGVVRFGLTALLFALFGFAASTTGLGRPVALLSLMVVMGVAPWALRTVDDAPPRRPCDVERGEVPTT